MKPKIRYPFSISPRITFYFGEAPKWYTDIFGYPHNGVDFGMISGTEIIACDDGVVYWADEVPDSDGCGVILKHIWGLSLYWHLSAITAKIGLNVKKADKIGLSGRTGIVTGPHLHFGIKVDNQGDPYMRGWIDPLKFMEVDLPLPPEPAPIATYHRVKFGESLWKIAEEYYKNGAEWYRIYNANKKVIKHPALIYPFQRLLIP